MTRKLMALKTKNGQPIRVSIGAKGRDHIEDPTGVLAGPSMQTPESEAGMTEFIQKVKSGEIKISYP